MSRWVVSVPREHSATMFIQIVLLLFCVSLHTTSGASLGDFISSSGGPFGHHDGAIPEESSAKCDMARCFSDQGTTFSDLNCAQARYVYSCIRKLSCQGNLEYHTILTLARKKNKQCSSDARSNVRSGDSSNTSQSIHRPNSHYRKTRPVFEPLVGQALNYCTAAAYNYTISSPVISMQQFVAQHDANTVPLHRVANMESYDSFSSSRSRMERFRRSTDLQKASQAALQLMRSHQQRSTESQVRGGIAALEEMPQSDQPQSITDLVYMPNKPPMPMITCIVFGDPHLRTFDSRYQTCNSLGTRPLIEHPLFFVQITNSRLKEQFNTTGVTKVIVVVRAFGPCQINSNLVYETDSIAQLQPSQTFTDGSVNNFGNLVYIKSSSQGQMVTLHLNHIGARVYISQFKNTHFLNVVVKFRSSNDNSYDPLAILNAISPYSMCKSGCHPKEAVDLKAVLLNAGVDIEPQKDDIVSEEIVDIDEEPLEQETQQVEHTLKKQHRRPQPEDYDDYDDYEDIESSKRPPKRRSRRDESSTGKPRGRKNRNKNKNKKNKRKQKPSGVDDAFLLLRSSSSSQSAQFSLPDTRSAMPDDELEDSVPAEVEPEPLTPHEQCESMREYYRLTCLYDVAVKGISNIDPHRFAISFDERRLQNTNFTYSFDSHSYFSSSAGHPQLSMISCCTFVFTLLLSSLSLRLF